MIDEGLEDHESAQPINDLSHEDSRNPVRSKEIKKQGILTDDPLSSKEEPARELGPLEREDFRPIDLSKEELKPTIRPDLESSFDVLGGRHDTVSEARRVDEGVKKIKNNLKGLPDKDPR